MLTMVFGVTEAPKSLEGGLELFAALELEMAVAPGGELESLLGVASEFEDVELPAVDASGSADVVGSTLGVLACETALPAPSLIFADPPHLSFEPPQADRNNNTEKNAVRPIRLPSSEVMNGTPLMGTRGELEGPSKVRL